MATDRTAAMSRLCLTLACWDYDRTRALADGTVTAEGIDLTYLSLPVEETFFRMLRHREFDVAELSLSSYCVSLARDPRPFVALPVFPSRFFRHSSIYVNVAAGIAAPADLKGRRVGAPEYQMTAPVWIRGILSDEYGLKVTDVEHLTGGEESPGRDEKIALDLPPDIRVRCIGPDQTLSRMLLQGEIAALFTARRPSSFVSHPDRVARLFPGFVAVERDYFARTGIFPIMHVVAMRREVYEANRWIAQSLTKAFVAAKRIAQANLWETAALKTMLPWGIDHVEQARAAMGDDWWSYGLAPNRTVLETFLRYHHEQGLSRRLLRLDELFAPEALEAFTI
jgi:4,5-dihydroxyphthalate decarboxylase